MKDITSTSFGLIIAFLLPGVAGFYSLSFFIEDIEKIFSLLITAKSNSGLVILVIMASLVIGLIITSICWVIYEVIIDGRKGIKGESFGLIGESKDKLMAYRATVDDYYRFYQFFGSMSIVLPVLLIGYLYKHHESMSSQLIAGFIAIVVTFEVLMIFAACEAFDRLMKGSNSLLKEKTGEQDERTPNK